MASRSGDENRGRVAPDSVRGAVVGVTERCRAEVQWHPPGAARVRRLAFSWPSLGRLTVTLGLAGPVFAFGGMLFGLNRSPRGPSFDSVRLENAALRAEQEVLRVRGLDLAEQLVVRVEEERRLRRMTDAFGQASETWCPRPPPKDAGKEAVFGWLSEQGLRLEVFADELAERPTEQREEPASGRLSVNRREIPVCDFPVPRIASIGSSARQIPRSTKR